MGFPPVQDFPFVAFMEDKAFVQIWDSPPTADPQPREIEMTLAQEVQPDESSCCAM